MQGVCQNPPLSSKVCYRRRSITFPLCSMQLQYKRPFPDQPFFFCFATDFALVKQSPAPQQVFPLQFTSLISTSILHLSLPFSGQARPNPEATVCPRTGPFHVLGQVLTPPPPRLPSLLRVMLYMPPPHFPKRICTCVQSTHPLP